MDGQLETEICKALMDCYNHLDRVRVEGLYCVSSFAGERIDGRPYHPVSAHDVPGNLAACAVIDGHSRLLVANSLIAPSFTLSPEIRARQRDQFLESGNWTSQIASKIDCSPFDDPAGVYDSGKIWVNSGSNPNEAHWFDEPIRAIDSESSSDSEHVLINVVDDGIGSKSLPTVSVVIIATERIPCKGCTNTMIEFLKKRRDVRLVVAYTFDTKVSKRAPKRQASDFLAELPAKLRSRVRIARALIDADTLVMFSDHCGF